MTATGILVERSIKSMVAFPDHVAPLDASSPDGDPPMSAVQGAAADAGGSDTTARSTRDRIIDAAMELFHQNGYTATGISSILRQAGVNSGSLYHFFPTKEDLLLALLERYKEILYPAVMDPVFSRVTDPLERVFGVLDGYRQMLIFTGCSLGCPIGNLALELSDTHPAVRQKIAENFDGWKKAVRRCLDEAGDRLPADLDREALASFVLTVMEGGMMQAKAYKSLDPFDAAVTQLRDYFDRLLADGGEWSRPRSPSHSEPAEGDAPDRIQPPGNWRTTDAHD